MVEVLTVFAEDFDSIALFFLRKESHFQNLHKVLLAIETVDFASRGYNLIGLYRSQPYIKHAQDKKSWLDIFKVHTLKVLTVQTNTIFVLVSLFQ